jgi:hypothetical protein
LARLSALGMGRDQRQLWRTVMDQVYASNTQRRVWRKFAVVGLVLGVATIALAGVGSLAQAQPAPRNSVSLLNVTDNFEGTPLSVWELIGHTGGPRWNYRSISQTFGMAHSITRAMWFGNPATGQYGGIGCEDCPVYSGTLTYVGPAISIPVSDTRAFLNFWSWEYTEMSELPGGFSDTCLGQATCPFDVRQVWVLGTSDPDWVLKWDTSVNATIELAWHPVTIDISEYTGDAIQMRFTFSTDPNGTDGWNNDGRGWYVDDVNILSFIPSHNIRMPVVVKNH